MSASFPEYRSILVLFVQLRTWRLVRALRTDAQEAHCTSLPGLCQQGAANGEVQAQPERGLAAPPGGCSSDKASCTPGRGAHGRSAFRERGSGAQLWSPATHVIGLQRGLSAHRQPARSRLVLSCWAK